MQTYDPGKSTPEIRQGSRRLMNLRVLVFSLLGLIIAFGLIYLLFFIFAPGPGTAN